MVFGANIVVFGANKVVFWANTVIFVAMTIVSGQWSGQRSAVTVIGQCQLLMKKGKRLSDLCNFVLQEMTVASKN